MITVMQHDQMLSSRRLLMYIHSDCLHGMHYLSD